MTFDTYEVALTLAGLAALIAAWIPAYTSRRPLSLPIVLVAAGALFFLLPLGLPVLDPSKHLERDRARDRTRRHRRADGRRVEDRSAVQLAHVADDVADARHRHAGHHRVDGGARRHRGRAGRDQRAAAGRRPRTHGSGAGVRRAGRRTDARRACGPPRRGRRPVHAHERGRPQRRAGVPVRLRGDRRRRTRLVAVGVGSDVARVGPRGADPHRAGCRLGRGSRARRRGLPTAGTVERARRDPAGVRRDRGDLARVRRDRAPPGLRLPRGVRRRRGPPGHGTGP